MIVDVGMDDVAEDDVADLRGFDAGAVDRFTDADCRQLARRGIFQAASEAADRRPYATQNNDFAWIVHRWFSWYRIAGPFARTRRGYASRVPTRRRSFGASPGLENCG